MDSPAPKNVPVCLVTVDHDASAGRRGVGQSQSGRRAPRFEETLASAQNDGKKPQAILVDEIVVDECSGQSGTAVHLDLVTLRQLLRPSSL